SNLSYIAAYSFPDPSYGVGGQGFASASGDASRGHLCGHLSPSWLKLIKQSGHGRMASSQPSVCVRPTAEGSLLRTLSQLVQGMV
ncbi:hypothetical protein QWZ14_05660, partial [Paeniroseomonas aquatica]